MPDFPTCLSILLSLSALSRSVSRTPSTFTSLGFLIKFCSNLSRNPFWPLNELVLFWGGIYYVPSILWSSVLGNLGSIIHSLSWSSTVRMRYDGMALGSAFPLRFACIWLCGHVFPQPSHSGPSTPGPQSPGSPLLELPILFCFKGFPLSHGLYFLLSHDPPDTVSLYPPTPLPSCKFSFPHIKHPGYCHISLL